MSLSLVLCLLKPFFNVSITLDLSRLPLDIINILMVVIFSQILRFTTLMKSFQ